MTGRDGGEGTLKVMQTTLETDLEKHNAHDGGGDDDQGNANQHVI